MNAPLIRKVRFPRETIPASVAAVQLVTFLVMLALLVPVALIVRGTLDPSLLLLPLVAAALFCLVLGFSLASSVLHAHYRDVEPVLAALLLPWFFLTPIFLRVDDLDERLALVTARARNCPDWTNGSRPAMSEKMIWMRPATRSVRAGPRPLYGTCTMSTFAIVLNSSAVSWSDEPMPDEP